jgi:phosphatidyl-myo-inositol alpha-mannosyltransferase
MKRKLKIGFVLDDSLDTPDGVQQYVLALGKWLTSKGHEVHYLVGQTHRTDLAHIHSLGRNVHVRFNQNRMSIPLPVSQRRIHALLQAEQFDVLHVQMPYSPMLGARVISATSEHTAVIGTFHVAPNSKVVYSANKSLSLLLRSSLKRFDEVISVSPLAATLARKAFGLESSIVPNTVALEPFYKGHAFAEYTKPTVVFLGRLVERKGAQHLLRAVAYIQRNHLLASNDWHVIICGTGPLDNSLMRYAEEHHLNELVQFTGFLAEADKPCYLASADVAIFPSTGGESFGIVLIEAMAAARGIVLAGNNPGYAAVMADHPESLFDPTDERALGNLLVHIVHDPVARQDAHTWQHAQAHQYDVPVVGEKVLAVYGSALRKRQR